MVGHVSLASWEAQDLSYKALLGTVEASAFLATAPLDTSTLWAVVPAALRAAADASIDGSSEP